MIIVPFKDFITPCSDQMNPIENLIQSTVLFWLTCNQVADFQFAGLMTETANLSDKKN